MRCQEVNELLVTYLDGEVSPSERTLILAHLAGCASCRKELAALSATQSRVSRSLQVRAAQAAPSPQAWSRLQARLARACPEHGRREARPSPPWLPAWLQRLAPDVGRIKQVLEGGLTMKKGFTLAAIATLVIALGTVAFVPSARAQVGEILNTWFRFETPSGEGEVAISGTAEFVPLHPTYLPIGFQTMGFAIGGKPESIELVYYSEEQFLTITQSKAPADKPLPAGQKVTVNGQSAVLVTGLEGAFKFNPRFGFYIPKGAFVVTGGTPPAEPGPYHGDIAYTDGKQLTWYVGDVRVEMLSNLPEEETLKIAASLVPAEAGEGEPPFQPSLDLLPSGGERRVIEIEGGSIIIREGPIESNP